MVWFFQLLLKCVKIVVEIMSAGPQSERVQLPTADRAVVETSTSDISAIPEEPCPNSSNPASTDTGAVIDPSPSRTMGERETRADSDGATGNQSPANSHASSCHSALSGSGSSSVSGRAGLTTVTRRSSTMTKHSGSGGGAESAVNSLDLDGFDVLRFRSQFLQTVEELRMRREADVKKEKRIRELMEEKHQLQQKCDEVESVYSQHLEQCSHQEQEIRKQFTSQIRQLEGDKARQVCLEETRHKEIKALKDEIRALQLSKYNLEKKVEDQERQLQVQTLSRESMLSEMSGVETKYQTVLAQVSATATQMTHLEANVKEAVELNRKLRYVNEHQKCLLAGREEELDCLRQDLVQARGSVADRLADRGKKDQMMIGRKTAAQELKMTVELNKQLQVQLSGVRGEHQTVLDQLKEAHSLLDKHIETCNRAQENERQMGEDIGRLQEEKEGLEMDVRGLKEQLTSQKQEWSTGVEEWKTKVTEVEQRLRRLQEDYSELQKTHDELEAERRDCEHRLRSEIESLRRERQEREKEGEKAVKDLQEEIKELKRSQREAEAQRAKNPENKEVQVSAVSVMLSPNATRQQLGSTTNSSSSSGPPVTVRQSPTKPLTTETMTARDESAIAETGNAVVTPESVGVGDQTNTAESAHPVIHREVNVPSNNEVPSPPNSSPLLTEDHPVMPATPVGLPSLTLPSPRLHLERIHLPLKMEDEAVSGRQSSKDISSYKRRFERQQSNLNSSSGTGSPAKKQKLLPRKDSVPADNATNFGAKSALSLDTQKSERQLDSHIFTPLSQPPRASSNREHKEESLSLSQSAAESRYRKGKSIPWTLDLPQLFYATSTPSGSGKLPPGNTENEKGEETHVSSTPPSDGKNRLNTNVNPTATNTKNTPTPSDNTPTGNGGKNTSLPTAPPNTPLKASPPLRPAETHTTTPSSLVPTTESSADQSVPRSPGGSNNFAIVFSEGEDEGEEDRSRGKDKLLSSQMNKQIQKVTTFLKMDRLRRTKMPKL